MSRRIASTEQKLLGFCSPCTRSFEFTGSFRPERFDAPGSGFTFAGLRSRSNNVSIDGLDNNDEYTGSSRTELSPEIAQEFHVVNNGLSAESGGASAGSINDNHQLTKKTALMLRYTFTNNKEAGNVFNSSGLFDASTHGSSFTSDNALSGSLTTVLSSEAVSDVRFQAATRHAVLRTNEAFGPELMSPGWSPLAQSAGLAKVARLMNRFFGR